MLGTADTTLKFAAVCGNHGGGGGGEGGGGKGGGGKGGGGDGGVGGGDSQPKNLISMKPAYPDVQNDFIRILHSALSPDQAVGGMLTSE